ncbi:MAG: hypothetical protein ACRD03_01790 [Acidimicrobiales bacterium]
MSDARVDAFLSRVTELGLRPGDIALDEDRSVVDYPRMPGGTCHLSARFLAEIYPELRPVSGKLTFVASGVDCEIDHSWCTRADGQIVDPTWEPADGSVSDVTYWPT